MSQLGNLDSKNSLEIMNIIKSISKEKLVILVTHEEDLAKFYATRIIEIQDGTIKNDYINEHANDLDYQVENKIYLKDFKTYSKKQCYEKLAKDFNLDFQEICVIGDSYENDIIPARELGCKVVLISKETKNIGNISKVKSIEDFINLENRRKRNA